MIVALRVEPVCLCVYTYSVYICIYTHIHIYIHKYMHKFIYGMHTYTHTYIHTLTNIHAHTGSRRSGSMTRKRDATVLLVQNVTGYLIFWYKSTNSIYLFFRHKSTNTAIRMRHATLLTCVCKYIRTYIHTCIYIRIYNIHSLRRNRQHVERGC